MKTLTGQRYTEIFKTVDDDLDSVRNWQLVQAFVVLREVSHANARNADIMANTLVWDRLAGVLTIARYAT